MQTISRQAAHNERQLVQLAGSDRQDWLVAEAEYLLRLANQRLNLERDVDSSRAMLEAADKVLAETRNPAFDAVRSKLAREIQSLRLVPGVDRVGAVVRLQAMQDALDQVNWLPVSGMPTQSHTASASPVVLAWYEQLWQEMKAGLADVIRIRRQDTPVAVPLSPEQAYYLQQNARLMLEQAQLAMLRRDQNLYDRSLQRVIGWIDQYLPDEDMATRELRILVKELQGWQVNPAVPDISGSLQLLRDRLALANDGVMPLEDATQPGSQSTPDGAQP
nr:uroporphyrinogen-III C-methyltransferase [Oceanobacter mangrovi]